MSCRDKLVSRPVIDLLATRPCHGGPNNAFDQHTRHVDAVLLRAPHVGDGRDDIAGRGGRTIRRVVRAIHEGDGFDQSPMG